LRSTLTAMSTGGTKPSVYISEIKLKKAFGLLKDEYLEDLFDKEMSRIAIQRHREKLIDKLESIHAWQLFRALEIYLERGGYEAAEFVLMCKMSDIKPEK
jgi:hypothetical protein